MSYGAILGVPRVPALLAIGALQGVSFAAASVGMIVYLMDIMLPGRTGMVIGLYSEAENVGGMLAAPSRGGYTTPRGPITRCSRSQESKSSTRASPSFS